MNELKHNKNVGQTSTNSKKELSNDESHNRREHLVFSDKITSMTEENSKNSSKDNTLQKRSPKNKKKKWHISELTDEFKKTRPANFEGETKEGAEAWLLNMGKYFQIYNYFGNLRDGVEIYKLNGKDAILWKETK
jgi:hypothetical protein